MASAGAEENDRILRITGWGGAAGGVGTEGQRSHREGDELEDIIKVRW